MCRSGPRCVVPHALRDAMRCIQNDRRRACRGGRARPPRVRRGTPCSSAARAPQGRGRGWRGARGTRGRSAQLAGSAVALTLCCCATAVPGARGRPLCRPAPACARAARRPSCCSAAAEPRQPARAAAPAGAAAGTGCGGPPQSAGARAWLGSAAFVRCTMAHRRNCGAVFASAGGGSCCACRRQSTHPRSDVVRPQCAGDSEPSRFNRA